MFEWLWRLMGWQSKPDCQPDVLERWHSPPAVPGENEIVLWCGEFPWIPVRPGVEPPRIRTYHTPECKKAMGDTPYSDPNDRWGTMCKGGCRWDKDGE